MADPKIVLCRCTPTTWRNVYLHPGIDPRFLFGKCGGCNKSHQYLVGQVPVYENPMLPKKLVPQKVQDDGATVAADPDISVLLEGDVVKMIFKNKAYHFGKIEGGRFVKWENANGIHKTTDSFGLPNTLFKWLENRPIKFIRIIWGGMHYDTSTENWRAKGFFLYFKGKAEKRIYLRRKDFGV